MKDKTKVIILLIIGIILSILFMIGGAFVIDLTDMHAVGAVILVTGIVFTLFWIVVIAEVWENLR